MTEELKKLKKEFLRIKSLGYVKSTKKGYTSIDKTFEDLLEEKKDKLSRYKYNGIELKTKREYSKSYTTLFNLSPEGTSEREIKRLRDNYGNPAFPSSKIKVLNVSVQANSSTFVAQRFLFKLHINYEEEKVYLVISNQNFTILESNTYWSFKSLREKLENRSQYMALIKAWTNCINEENYYKYYDMEFYKLKTFKEFLKLLAEGTIRITIKMGVFKDEPRRNKIHDKEISFEIQDIDLLKLFEKMSM